MHLIIDGYECASELLYDPGALMQWLNRLPRRIDMSVLVPAVVAEIKIPRCRQSDEGVSGIVMIYESHIAVHTWPQRREMQADVYSCKPFDAEAVLAHFVHDFGMGSYDAELIARRKR